MSLRLVPILLLLIVLWSFNGIAIKLGVSEIPPLLMTALRFLIVAIMVVPFTRLKKGQLPLVILISFTFGTLHFAMLFLGFARVDSGTGILMSQLGTPIATVLAVLFLKERLLIHQVGGLLISFAGIAVLSGGPAIPDASTLAILIVSAFGWGVTNILVKISSGLHPVTMAGWSSLFAIPQVVAASWLSESDQLEHLVQASWRAWCGVFYIAVMSSILAYSLWYGLLKKYPVNSIMPFSLLGPVGAIGTGCWLMGESLSFGKLLGAGLVIGGVALTSVSIPVRNLGTRV